MWDARNAGQRPREKVSSISSSRVSLILSVSLYLFFLSNSLPPLSAIISVNLFVASTPGLSLDSAPQGLSELLSRGCEGISRLPVHQWYTKN